MLWNSFVVAAAFAGTVTALAVPETHIVHEKRDYTSRRWAKRDRAKPHARLPVRIGLAQNNLDKAHDYLMDVSHPTSPNYGKHWTSEEVIEAFKPSDDAVQTVRQWLVDAGISVKEIVHSDNKQWLAFDASTKQMESLLHTEYHEYEDIKTGGVMPACDQYHVPKHIQQHIDYITPANLSICDKEITPACVAALYKIPPAPRDVVKSNSMGIFEAELQFWDQVDLDKFFTNFTNIPNGTHPIDYNIDGAVSKTTNVSEAGVEAMLDLELAYPIVYPQTISIFNEDDLFYQAQANQTYNYGYNTFLDAIDGSYCTYSAYGETGDLPNVDPTYPDPNLGGYKGQLQCGIYKPTNVFSFSYGGQEADIPVSYQKRQCNEYLKLGLQGISFIFASGDSGVGNAPVALGGDNGPSGCLGPNDDIFNPTWPVNCPYVTSVGATKVYPGSSVFDAQPESAVYDPAGHPYQSNYSSGGGFSNVYGIPSFQKSAVATYFADHDPGLPYYSGLAKDSSDVYAHPDVAALAGSSGGIYNRIGRGIPDVAANGDNIATYALGSFALHGGTSASTPIFSAIINRINEERLKRGKKTVGFLNPTLYAHPEVLNDIVNGTNKACQGEGFNAVKGWDPVTGLGTPNYPKMLELFLSLP
ncbi:hypothetical protein M409DRAFT_63728 [Zasmidium cellare ATCC 36951]|uniref:tripeptidyl-peptidase II n=1 Tax=Zasmidium cellare ATCC 36951 TaxID=1080233 RepID=A0A6A6CZ47_ZASCE|nr:uncharacterized protein M409DRAFT_63728 [Zasmidium cellare ATCC 36951]KAF2171470.1 hypothetical protein M409DRAFT_63728 [Zasmidium cellare ATCC 36951]